MLRDAAMVQRDGAEGLISSENAGGDYGVVLDRDSHAIDQRATQEFRSGLMRDRNPGKLFDRGAKG